MREIWIPATQISNAMNIFSFSLTCFAILGQSQSQPHSPLMTFFKYVTAYSLYSFVGFIVVGSCLKTEGGITNWLAVVMLFDKIPGIYGSGLIPNNFKEIRESLKNAVLRTFFEETYMTEYFKDKFGAVLLATFNFSLVFKNVVASPKFITAVDEELQAILDRPEGAMLKMMGVQPAQLRGMVMPFINNMGDEIGTKLLTFWGPKPSDIGKFRDQVDGVMTAKLLELTPERVKQMMEEVIRSHCRWIIVWGNILGGCLGLICFAFGYE